MQSYFAIIVGAGPGGLACARILAEHGHKVLVLERKKRVGPKVCGGGITWSGLIRRVPEDLIDSAFADQYISSNRQSIKLSASSPIVATVSREKLGQWMLHQAVTAGAEVKTDVTVNKIEGHQVSTTAGDFAFRYLIGADGSASLVRKYLRLDTEHIGIGIDYQVPGDFSKMEWHLDTDLFGNGYAWIFPFKDRASIGVYKNDKEIKPALLLERLKLWAAGQGINLRPLKPRAGLINFDYRGWRFGNTMLVGDAAGLASGLTGEGIYPSMVSGETAARTILTPNFEPTALNALIHKQQKHRQVLNISGINKAFCAVTMELLVAALRTKLLDFKALEMAD